MHQLAAMIIALIVGYFAIVGIYEMLPHSGNRGGPGGGGDNGTSTIVRSPPTVEPTPVPTPKAEGPLEITIEEEQYLRRGVAISEDDIVAEARGLTLRSGVMVIVKPTRKARASARRQLEVRLERENIRARVEEPTQ